MSTVIRTLAHTHCMYNILITGCQSFGKSPFFFLFPPVLRFLEGNDRHRDPDPVLIPFSLILYIGETISLALL